MNLCPSTTDEGTARAWIEQWAPRQIAGLMLKPTGGSYRPGRGRGGWRRGVSHFTERQINAFARSSEGRRGSRQRAGGTLGQLTREQLGDHIEVNTADRTEFFFTNRATVYPAFECRQNASASSISGGQ